MTAGTVRLLFRYCLSLDIALGAFLGNSITVLFYTHHNLTPSQTLTVQASLSLAVVLADIPAGHLADRFGVPRSMLLGTILQTTQSLFFVPLHGFWAFETLAICTGISWCFLTNTTSSIMQSQQDGELFRTYKSRLAWSRPLAQAASALLGGYLAEHASVDLPYLVQPVINGCAVLAAWRLVVLSRAESVNRPKHALWHSLKTSVRTMLVEAPAVRWLVLLTAVNNVSLMAGLWLLQPELLHVGVRSLTVFGLLYATRALLAGVFGWFRGFTGLPLLESQAMIFSMAAGTTLIAGLPVGWFGVAALVVGNAFLAGLLEQTQEVALNELLPKRYEHRTTELSVNTAVKSALYFVVARQLGWIIQTHSVGAAFLAISTGTLLFGGVALWRFRAAISVLQL